MTLTQEVPEMHHDETKEMTEDVEPSPGGFAGMLAGGSGFMLPPRPKLTRWIVAIVLLVGSFIALMWYFFGDRIAKYLHFGKPAGEKLVAPQANPQAQPDEENVLARLFPKAVTDEIEKETEDSLLQLASTLREKGFKVYGMPTCIYTKAQRSVFGVGTARKAFEEIFVECVPGPNVCQQENIKAFPTWRHAASGMEKKGFLTPEALRAIAAGSLSMDPIPPAAPPASAPLGRPAVLQQQQQPTQPPEEEPGFKDVTDDHEVHEHDELPDLVEHVEHARGVTEAGPPLDAPVRINDRNSMQNLVNRSDFRIQQGDVPRMVGPDTGDETSVFAQKMNDILQQAIHQTNTGAIGNSSYESGRAVGEARVSMAQDTLASRDVPIKEYIKN